MNIISIGEVLWDVFEKAEHIGGATFNFSAHAARLGHNVLFVSAVGQDDRGERALKRMGELALSANFVRRTKEAATGFVTVFVNAQGQPDFTLHRPAAYDFPSLCDADLRALSALMPDWIYFGTLAQMTPRVRAATKQVVAANPHARRFYDINLRENAYTTPLVRELMSETTFLKINDDEINAVTQMFSEPTCPIEEFCNRYANRFGWEGICVTRGAAGCSIFLGGEYIEVPGYKVEVVDTVGAGDAFAAAFIHGLGSGWKTCEIGDFANRLGALVASKAGAVPSWTMDELRALAR